ncbi:CotH kinase family protein [Promethearchaeum syntrophicum]|uniref:CotH kinase family protein n=1 Tax=Promethearchaeum syntrophicum TaxID=2594042 RepID=A0A5B9DFQ9_9ARCH|nr:CotH kinase family protein [Candidatus Prometheoarchaeum syntrophicum]QEE17952.1 CotH protein [Candidatus Prometheoarchaeum syntrophicum]
MKYNKVQQFIKRMKFKQIISVLFFLVILANIWNTASLYTMNNSATVSESSNLSEITGISECIESTISSSEITSTETSTKGFEQVSTLYDVAEPFFDDSYVHEINLYFEDEDWYDQLYDGHAYDSDDPYFPAKFVYDDIEIDPIGINFKGHSSFMSNTYKKSFRIDFNYYNQEIDFYGLKKLNLNNGYLDPTMLREKLFWDFASNYVSTVRCVYTRVYVNDEYYGLFTAIEQIDDEFVESRYGSKEDGNLFRAESAGTLTYLGESESLYSTNYELKTNEYENDFSSLIKLTDVLTNTPTEDFQEEIEKILDVNDTLYCMALLNLFASLDSYLGSAHNFYLYESDETGLFKHILWDSNEAFGRFTFGVEEGQNVRLIDPYWTPSSTSMDIPDGPPPPRSVDTTEEPDSQQGEFANLGTERPLFERLLEIDSYNQTYTRILAEMIRDGFNQEFMSDQIEIFADLIREDFYADPNQLFTNEQFEMTLTDGYPNQNNIFGLESFVEIRSTYLSTILDSYASQSDMQFNEIMSLNQGVIADENGDFDSWIEIYNLGPGTVSLKNLYLTDKFEEPNKWEFPDDILEDGDTYLVWADNETEEGLKHLSFTLQQEGGQIFLFMESNEGSMILVDKVDYTSLNENISYGKYPDGDGIWQEMSDFPTPNASNCEDEMEIKLPTTLYINEIMAENENAVEDPDDLGDFPDWIELYNSANISLDLGGLYLTDNAHDPFVWQFPENAIIEAESFLVIWADGDLDQENLHSSFKLSGNGEDICLISNDGSSIIDWISYSDTIQDFSLGRIPDGSENWEEHISTPTPGYENSNLEIVQTSSVETGFFYVFIGGLIGLIVLINVIHKKVQDKDNGQFWLTTPAISMESKENIPEMEENLGSE